MTNLHNNFKFLHAPHKNRKP